MRGSMRACTHSEKGRERETQSDREGGKVRMIACKKTSEHKKKKIESQIILHFYSILFHLIIEIITCLIATTILVLK